MKKLLKVTALALMGFASALVAKAEFAPEANHPYYLRLNDTDRTLDLVHPQTDNGDNQCAGVSTDKTPVLIEAGTGTNAGKFAVKSLQNGKYLYAHTNWNVHIGDEPYYWTVSETTDGYLNFSQTRYSPSNNPNKKYLGEQSGHTGILYQDNTLTSANCDWVLEDASGEWAFVHRVVYKVNGVEHYAIDYSDDAWRMIEMQTVPFFEADNGAPSVVESGEFVFYGHYTHSLVNTTDLDNPQYFLVKNLRTSGNRAAGRNGVTYAATPGSSGQVELKVSSELNVDNHYHTGALWYMQTAGMVDSDGYLPVRLYNAYTSEAIANPANGTWATSDDNNTTWYLKANTQTYTGFNILHGKSVNDYDYAWNDSGGSGTLVAYWEGNDIGSIWAFELADEAKMSATIDKINEAYIAERKAYVDLINSYVEFGLIAFTEEQQSAWNAAATGRITNVNQLQTYMTTLHNQVNAATSTQLADGQGRHVQFLHDQRPAYIGRLSNGSVMRGGEEGTRTFTLKNAADGSGFYIFNEYTNKYVQHPTADNTNISMVSDESEASIYNFDLSNGTKGLVGVKVVGPSGHVSEEHPYLHSNADNTDYVNVVRSGQGDNSAWYIHFVDESQAATEYLAGAMASSEDLPTESSDVVGFVKVDADAISAARAAGEAVAEDAEATAKRAAGDAIYNALATMILNYPKSGEIYTITSSDGRGALIAGNDADNPYIWTSGKIGYSPNANADKWAVVEKDGKTYLYNVFAGKFANGFGYKQGGAASGVTYAWMLCDVASEVTFNGNIFSQPTDNTTRPFVIAGGEDTSGKARPGMMIIAGIGTPVPAIAGYSDNQDGCGFTFVKAGDVSEELMATINAALDNMEAVAADTREAAEAMVADLPENYADIVNHFSEEGVETFNTRMALIDENATADKVYGICTQAMPALNSTITLSMTDGLCYSIANVSDGKKYHALYGETSTREYEEQEDDDIAAAYNWSCSVEGDVVYFMHNNTYRGVERVVKFTLNGANRFTLSAGSKVGQVKLTPYGVEEPEVTARRVAALSDEGEEPAAEPEYILTSLGEGAKFTTTAIAEINADGNGADVIYDLQGRRLSAPAKGINIINGKKVFVK